MDLSVVLFRYSGLSSNTSEHTQSLAHALCKTLPINDQHLFWDALRRLHNVDTVFENLTLMSWGWYFPPTDVDSYAVATKIFLVLCGVVKLCNPTPCCPNCGSETIVFNDCSLLFGWRYRCERFSQCATRREKRLRKESNKVPCMGSISATKNTWINKSKDVAKAVFLTFAWINRMSVTGAARGGK